MSARRVLWIDAANGASGDMFLGCLVDLGVPLPRIRRALETLPIEGWTLRSRRVVRCGLRGRKVDVRVPGAEHGRDWSALKRVVEQGDLPPSVAGRALSVFRRLIEAEAEVHGKPPDRVHLHEAGGTDAIVDVVGACVGLESLSVDEVVVSEMTTGFGQVRCDHGVYPVPAPATVLLTRGFPVRGGEIEAERLTPTGAALLTTLADGWGTLPPMRPLRVGVGAGDRELGESPNMLRMILGESDGTPEALVEATREVGVLECTVDDATPQSVAFAAQRLFDHGALEVFTTPVTMKKGRLGHHLTVLVDPDRVTALSMVLLRETSSLGVRLRVEKRLELERSRCPVDTSFGRVRVKVGELDGRVVQVWPEYDDCAALAVRRDASLWDVQQAALRAYSDSRTRPRPGGNVEVKKKKKKKKKKE